MKTILGWIADNLVWIAILLAATIKVFIIDK